MGKNCRHRSRGRDRSVELADDVEGASVPDMFAIAECAQKPDSVDEYLTHLEVLAKAENLDSGWFLSAHSLPGFDFESDSNRGSMHNISMDLLDTFDIEFEVPDASDSEWILEAAAAPAGADAPQKLRLTERAVDATMDGVGSGRGWWVRE